MPRRLVALLAPTLVGCASLTTPYSPPPADAPAAVLTIQNLGTDQATLWPDSDAQSCTGPLQVPATFNMELGAKTEIALAADRDLSVSTMHALGPRRFAWPMRPFIPGPPALCGRNHR